MAQYDDWNKVDEDEEQELQDTSYFEGKRDVILFAIDASPSMLELRPDPAYEDGDVQTCHLLVALDAAMQIQKKKVVVGPADSVGIMLFNTLGKNEPRGQGADIKKNTMVLQPIGVISAPKIQELILLIDMAREDPEYLRSQFPPLEGTRIPTGDVFTSCNWIMRDGAPKTASKRIFLITDEDDPHPGPRAERLKISAQTTLLDLTQAGINIEPFFISNDSKPFDTTKFFSSVMLPGTIEEAEEDGGLPESLSITRIDDLLSQMRFHEVPKRSLFAVPFTLAPNFVIGIKGYGLVTEQKKGAYRYFVDLGDRLEPAVAKSVYVDEDSEMVVDRSKVAYGMTLGDTAAADESGAGGAVRNVPHNKKVFFTAEEVRQFRTLGLEPGLKLLGFKDRAELAFEDQVKHSIFIYPNELKYAGSRRTFAGLLKTMLQKDKIGIALLLARRNSSPVFVAMLPQAEKIDEGGWNDPPGIHLIALPFADDIRAAPIERAARTSEKLKDAARAWIDKLCVKNGTYPPDSYPNPSLAFHNAQLQAAAFREEFDMDAFEDLTEPKIDMIHKRAGKLMVAWKQVLAQDETASIAVDVAPSGGTKRKADVTVDEAEIRAKYDEGLLSKLRVDQLKDFLRLKSQPVSGKKDELVGRVSEWLDKHA